MATSVRVRIARAIDLAHAAGAEQSFDRIRPSRAPGERRAGDIGNDGVVAERSGVAMGRDERIHLGAQGRIALAGVAQERVARGRVARQRGMKDFGDLPPAIGRHHGRCPFSAA